MTSTEGVQGQAAALEATWDFAPYALLRTAGLQASICAELRFPRATRLLERYEELQEHLLRERELLSEFLHTRIHEHREQVKARRALINLRRDLYQLKPSAARHLEGVEGLLEAELHSRLTAFLVAVQEQESLHKGFAAQLESEYRAKRAQMQALVRAHPGFHAGLDVASSSMSEHLARYLEVAPEAPTAPWRSLEISLVSYFLRAAMKTSPLSRFTWVTALSWPPREQGPSLAGELDSGSFRVHVELNRSVLRALVKALLEHPTLSLHLKYRSNTDLIFDGEYAYVFTRQRSDKIIERYGRIRLTGAHRTLLSYVERHGALSLLELAGAMGEGVAQEQALKMLRKLVESALLVPRLALGDDQTEGLACVIQELGEVQQPLARDSATKLEEVRELLAQYAAGEGAARLACRTRIQQVLKQVLAMLSGDVSPEMTDRLIYENAVASARRFVAPPVLTRPEASEALLVAELVSLLDDTVHTQLHEASAFVQRYGVGGICRNAYEFLLPSLGGEQPAPPAPEVLSYVEGLQARRERLREARRAFFVHLLERTRAQAGQPEVSLEPDWVRARLSPEPVRTSRALTLLLQPAPRSGGFVLNAVFPGYGAMLARFAPLFRQDARDVAVLDALQQSLRKQTWPGRPAQLVLSSSHSVNVLPTLTPEALHSAGSPRAVQPEVKEVRLKELAVRHAPGRHALELVHPDGGVIVPLYLGLLATPFLPPSDERLTRLSPASLYRVNFVEVLEQLAGPPAGQVREWPRIRLGRLILLRRTWVVHDRQGLEREKGEEDFDYWIRLRRWAAHHGIPRQFFLYPPPDRHLQLSQRFLKEANRGAWLKPQLIDLDSAFSLQVWEKQCRGMSLPWHLQEVLPSPEDASIQVDGRAHASELCLELHLRQEH
ncbi:MAG TPA: lantibiotic dehydratase [Hyalangium sp.]|jgi:hypothetical protein|nr:lantibiotic dehydratase [Hyalangium sp.]